MHKEIFVKGARENNLQNIDVAIPRDQLVVLTGLSGSGKSSLAFDTIYAEGQRRYVESLSSYARMFLGQMDKPDVDYIEGLSPAISIDQKTTSKNPRSTVGTVTEIYDYMRLLWARVGTPHCPKCGKEIRQQTVDQIIDRIMALPKGTRIQVMAPVVRGRKGEHAKVFADARRSGYVRVRVDGQMYELDEDITLAKNIKHHIDIVVDRLIVRDDIASRLTDSVETVSHLTGGLVSVNLVREKKIFSSLRTTPVRTAESPLRNWHRACSPSITPSVLVLPAQVSVCSRRWTPRWWCPMRVSRFSTARWWPRAGTPSVLTASPVCISMPWRRSIISPSAPPMSSSLPP